MKITVIGVPGVSVGKHNLKDPRLDQAHELVEAKKKTYAQVDVLGEQATLEADAIVVARDRLPDLILQDLEFVETRLGRAPSAAEQAALEKIQAQLEAGRTVFQAGLGAAELQAVTAHNFHTNKPVTVADAAALADPDALMVRAFAEAGYICFLTVGGKENRAWPIRKGTTAWEAGGAIHSDIQKGFIRAEIIRFADFIAAGGETEAKRAGKLRLELKQYVMEDYDLVNFRFNK
jgi:ribosome-binding ATPase YchF (GTP1/OBG family)